MSRSHRILAIVAFSFLVLSAMPATAAPAFRWSLFDRFSPLDWIHDLWKGAGVDRSSRKSDGAAPPAAPRQLRGESGSMIDPSGAPFPQTLTSPDPTDLP